MQWQTQAHYSQSPTIFSVISGLILTNYKSSKLQGNELLECMHFFFPPRKFYFFCFCLCECEH